MVILISFFIDSFFIVLGFYSLGHWPVYLLSKFMLFLEKTGVTLFISMAKYSFDCLYNMKKRLGVFL